MRSRALALANSSASASVRAATSTPSTASRDACPCRFHRLVGRHWRGLDEVVAVPAVGACLRVTLRCECWPCRTSSGRDGAIRQSSRDLAGEPSRLAHRARIYAHVQPSRSNAMSRPSRESGPTRGPGPFGSTLITGSASLRCPLRSRYHDTAGLRMVFAASDIGTFSANVTVETASIESFGAGSERTWPASPCDVVGAGDRQLLGGVGRARA